MDTQLKRWISRKLIVNRNRWKSEGVEESKQRKPAMNKSKGQDRTIDKKSGEIIDDFENGNNGARKIIVTADIHNERGNDEVQNVAEYSGTNEEMVKLNENQDETDEHEGEESVESGDTTNKSKEEETVESGDETDESKEEEFVDFEFEKKLLISETKQTQTKKKKASRPEMKWMKMKTKKQSSPEMKWMK